MTQKMYYIGEVAEELDRVPHTIRIWQYQNRLPDNLLPFRDERGWRYWTSEQVEELKAWVLSEDLRPGKGLQTVKSNKE